MKRIMIGVLGCVLMVLAVSVSFGTEVKSATRDFYKEIEIFVDALSIVRMNYVTEASPRELISGALKGMLSSLDDYSLYMDKEGYREMREDTKGEFGGLGIEIGNRDGLLTIISPMADTPAEKAGLQPQDVIVKIDGEVTKDFTVHDAVKKLRGKPGTQVVLTIWREKEDKFFDVPVMRAVIEVKSIKKFDVLENGIGYVRIAEFQEGTATELESAVKELMTKNITGLVIDLRNNAGGLLTSAIGVSQLFLKKDSVIVSIKGRVQAQNKDFTAQKDSAFGDLILVILVNDGSASASEIFAGAIKYNGRGILVGEKTFGKGSVQTVIPLKDGTAVRLTTAEYFTPGGHSIQKKGIVPDVIVPLEKPVKPEGEEKPTVFDKLEKPSEAVPSRAVIDNQLKAALDAVKAIRAYKGMS
ncbi:MAG: S41 family peptidase [Candidatus Omnitrophica bacterium]|nr:S41 family peptidase [Candidatus Omnitrophota bacterium]